MDEPYYNEAGYEKQRGQQIALENSRMYNEMAMLKLVEVSQQGFLADRAVNNHHAATCLIND